MLCGKCGTDNAGIAEACVRCGHSLNPERPDGMCRDHHDRPAVSRCGLCQAELCADCTFKVGTAIFCRDCLPVEQPVGEENIQHTPLTVDRRTRCASPWKRFASAFVDIFILAFAAMILGGVFWAKTGVPPTSVHMIRFSDLGVYRLYVGLVALMVIAYYVGFTADEGQTPGKQLLHTAVVDSEGIPPTFGVSIVRFLSAIVSTLPLGLGFLVTLVDRDHRTLHDILASTQVISLDEVDEL